MSNSKHIHRRTTTETSFLQRKYPFDPRKPLERVLFPATPTHRQRERERERERERVRLCVKNGAGVGRERQAHEPSQRRRRQRRLVHHHRHPGIKIQCLTRIKGGVFLSKQTHFDAQLHGSLEQRNLLAAAELLADLGLSVRKAYISSDAGLFIDVFHVVTADGRKLTDPRVLSRIRRSLGPWAGISARTALELTGADRPGVLSEIFAVLAELGCAVNDANFWTHKDRMASLIFLVDEEACGFPLEDPEKMNLIESLICDVVSSSDGSGDARISSLTSVTAVTDAKRRLYRMMLEDSGNAHLTSSNSSASVPSITIENYDEQVYSLVNVQCPDRLELLFDIVRTLDLLNYVVFHGTINTVGDSAHMEFYMRHSSGRLIRSDAERRFVIQCLEVAIEQGAYKGSRLELCMVNQSGLLADVTRIFHLNSLSVKRAVISTHEQISADVFYVIDANGKPADIDVIATVYQSMKLEMIKMVTELQLILHDQHGEAGIQDEIGLSYMGNLAKRSLYKLGLAKIYDTLSKDDEKLYSRSYPSVGSSPSPLKVVAPTKVSFSVPRDTFDHVFTSSGWSSCSTDTQWTFTRKNYTSTEEYIFPQISIDRVPETEVASIHSKESNTASSSLASTRIIEGETNGPLASVVEGDPLFSDCFHCTV